MKKFVKATLVLALLGCSTLTTFTTPAASAAGGGITTTKTGYASAEDVNYQKSEKYVKNWGARGEDCVFLTTYAEDFYEGSYTYEVLSEVQGGTTQANAAQSRLYSELQDLMESKHSHKTSYDATKSLYKYTDCLRNDSSKISSFYSGTTLGGEWGSSPTWNREHTWPKSKGFRGNDATDIMMLRPTATSENSSRGNKPYGESNGFFDPNVELGNGKNARGVRGDCARIMLYSYARWGLASKMWQPANSYPVSSDKAGVMENVDILLKWMEEDPVDTWEMGRNDAVQSITGTRNVFVDYPEYAWLLFGKDIPEDMVTPSGIAMDGVTDSEESSSNSSSSSSSEEDSSVEESAPEEDSSVEESTPEEDSSVEESTPEEDSSVEESAPEEDSSVEESTPEEDSSVEESAPEEDSSVEESAPEEDLENSDSEESSSDDTSDFGGIFGGISFQGCTASLGGVASSVAIAILGAYALKKRKFK